MEIVDLIYKDANEIEEMSIAEQISNIIKSPLVPPKISEALADGLTETAGDLMNDYEQTPEYIALLLKEYKK